MDLQHLEGRFRGGALWSKWGDPSWPGRERAAGGEPPDFVALSYASFPKIKISKRKSRRSESIVPTQVV